MTVPRRIFRRVLLSADNVFQLERLYAFNRKFFPEWRPALSLRGEADGSARRRARVSPRGAAARSARPLGEARAEAARRCLSSPRVTLRVMAQPATTRSLGRLSEIAQVMVRHGFGYWLQAHKLTDLLPGRSAEARLAAASDERRLGARAASARGVRGARPDVRQVRAAAVDAARRRPSGHHRGAAPAPGRRAPVPVRGGGAGDRGGARQHDRAALPRLRRGAGGGRVDRAGASRDASEREGRRREGAAARRAAADRVRRPAHVPGGAAREGARPLRSTSSTRAGSSTSSRGSSGRSSTTGSRAATRRRSTATSPATATSTSRRCTGSTRARAC